MTILKAFLLYLFMTYSLIKQTWYWVINTIDGGKIIPPLTINWLTETLTVKVSSCLKKYKIYIQVHYKNLLIK